MCSRVLRVGLHPPHGHGRLAASATSGGGHQRALLGRPPRPKRPADQWHPSREHMSSGFRSGFSSHHFSLVLSQRGRTFTGALIVRVTNKRRHDAHLGDQTAGGVGDHFAVAPGTLGRPRCRPSRVRGRSGGFIPPSLRDQLVLIQRRSMGAPSKVAADGPGANPA